MKGFFSQNQSLKSAPEMLLLRLWTRLKSTKANGLKRHGEHSYSMNFFSINKCLNYHLDTHIPAIQGYSQNRKNHWCCYIHHSCRYISQHNPARRIRMNKLHLIYWYWTKKKTYIDSDSLNLTVHYRQLKDTWMRNIIIKLPPAFELFNKFRKSNNSQFNRQVKFFVMTRENIIC